MKKFLILSEIICLFGSLAGYSQNTDFGHGTVTVGILGYPKSYRMQFESDSILIANNFRYIQYQVNGNIIFRDTSKPDEKNFKQDTGYYGNAFEMSYLIKYDSNLLYYYRYSNGRLNNVVKYKLDTFGYEWFYRHGWTDSSLSLITKKEDSPRTISGLICYKGVGVERTSGDTVEFYYTKSPMKVVSPLNTYVGFGKFPFNIVRITFKVEWSDMGKVIPKGGYLLLQLKSYSEQIPNAKLFSLPEKVPVHTDIPFWNIVVEDNRL